MSWTRRKSTTVRPERPEDRDTVRRLTTAAFGGARVPALVDSLRESATWLDLAFVAERDDAVVGAISFVRGWLDAPSRIFDVLVLSPLAVHPERQRCGIGTQLVQETMPTLEDRREALVFVEGSPGYYSRLGFVAGEDLRFTAPSTRIPKHAFQVATLHGYEQDLMHGALVYPDAFWQHGCVGHPD
ncbi:MAG: N-acetyltransferase [Nocardioidaceae bacterium]